MTRREGSSHLNESPHEERCEPRLRERSALLPLRRSLGRESAEPEASSRAFHGRQRPLLRHGRWPLCLKSSARMRCTDLRIIPGNAAGPSWRVALIRRHVWCHMWVVVRCLGVVQFCRSKVLWSRLGRAGALGRSAGGHRERIAGPFLAGRMCRLEAGGRLSDALERRPSARSRCTKSRRRILGRCVEQIHVANANLRPRF